MRRIDWLHHTSSRQFLNHIHEVDHISQPLSEQAILEIQEKFLSNGFQYLKVGTPQEGRDLIQTFLSTLTLYNDIACISTTPNPIPFNTNIYTLLNEGGYLSSFEQPYLDEFFVEHFYYDFMWIEATLEVLTSSWFEAVKKTLIATAIDQHIPILICVYDQ